MYRNNDVDVPSWRLLHSAVTTRVTRTCMWIEKFDTTRVSLLKVYIAGDKPDMADRLGFTEACTHNKGTLVSTQGVLTDVTSHRVTSALIYIYIYIYIYIILCFVRYIANVIHCIEYWIKRVYRAFRFVSCLGNLSMAIWMPWVFLRLPLRGMGPSTWQNHLGYLYVFNISW